MIRHSPQPQCRGREPPRQPGTVAPAMRGWRPTWADAEVGVQQVRRDGLVVLAGVIGLALSLGGCAGSGSGPSASRLSPTRGDGLDRVLFWDFDDAPAALP